MAIDIINGNEQDQKNHQAPDGKTQPVKIIVLAGSLRADSYNKKLVREAAAGAETAGAKIVEVNLADYEIPLFSEDLEAAEGAPAAVRDLKQMIAQSQGILLASPEYNGSISGVLKNAIDWISRPDPTAGAENLPAFQGKVIGLMSASPGALGGLRGLAHVRDIFTALGSLVLPGQVAVGAAYQAFDDQGRLKDSPQQDRVQAIGAEVTRVASALSE